MDFEKYNIACSHQMYASAIVFYIYIYIYKHTHCCWFVLLLLICFARMDFSEQYHTEVKAWDVRFKLAYIWCEHAMLYFSKSIVLYLYYKVKYWVFSVFWDTKWRSNYTILICEENVVPRLNLHKCIYQTQWYMFNMN
jgi:hypothetical protein